jgi:hypothetical protein
MKRAIAMGSGIVAYRQPYRSGTRSISAGHWLLLDFPVGGKRSTR